jgi:hypothetical protein
MECRQLPEPGLGGPQGGAVANTLAQVQAHWAYGERRTCRSGLLGQPAYEFNLNLYKRYRMVLIE